VKSEEENKNWLEEREKKKKREIKIGENRHTRGRGYFSEQNSRARKEQ